MEFQLKPRLDAMRWAFNDLKRRSDDLGFYILGVSLTISCVESIKLVLDMGDNKVFKIIPIVLSLGVGCLSAYTKKCNFNEKLELLLNSINDVTHILLDIRNAPSITKDINEAYVKALSIAEGSTDPKSRGEAFKSASKNLIAIQKQTLKYKACLDKLVDPEIGLSIDIDTDSATTETGETPKKIKDVIVNNTIEQNERFLLPPSRESVANKIQSVGADQNKDGAD
tara:strand:- start:1432 stop:2109 length:678 start_codon:yes stop_codon:yes gene_type:complete